MSLTPPQQRFILEYLADPARNGKAAAIRAGYSSKGQCPNVIASKLLADPEVQAEISRQLRGYCQKLEVDAEMVVAGVLESIETWKRSGIGAWQMQGIQRGYELLGRYLGMFHDKLDVSADDKIIEQLIRGRRYAAVLPEDDREENEEELPEEPAKPN